MTSPRTVIIGLDGATFDLIDPLIEAGELPTLRRIMTEGVRGILETWPNTNSAAAWSSMITGYNSGEHGVYHFGEAISRPGVPWRPVTATDRKKDPFWRLLSAAGKPVGVINVPISYPADQINGFMLAGMDTPGLSSSGFAHPSELRNELSNVGIEYIIDVPNLGVASKRDPHHLPESVERMIDARSNTILHLMQSRPWDVLMAVFVATDRVQHYFWPNDLSAVHSPDWTPIRRVYQKIDGFLAELLARLDSETTLLLVSDHGFGSGRAVRRELNRLFERLGLLRYRKGGERLKSRMLRRLLGYGRRFIPGVLQDRLARAMPALHLRAVNEHRFSGVDWPSTRVFASPNGGRVSINLEGREQYGTVSQQDYHALREHTRDILLSLTDATAGKRLVRDVRCREEVYRGPYTDHAADLLIEWNYEALGDTLCYSAEGSRIVVEASAGGASNNWNGSHRREGIFIARGPHIKSGLNVTGANIYDVAPTILHLQNHPVPDDMDGKVLTEIFKEAFLRDHGVRFYRPETKEGPQSTGLDASEAREIEERLRGLGYIE
ncbi:MAG TPA: alkaline phosphatase family protein [Blastocatellia bacterium]|nr:alkaline phosphatase family protein [Blastocatellia bacterium]